MHRTEHRSILETLVVVMVAGCGANRHAAQQLELGEATLTSVETALSVPASVFLAPGPLCEGTWTVEPPGQHFALATDASLAACSADEQAWGHMPFSIAAVEIRPDVLTLAGCEVQKLEEGRVREQDLRAGVMLQLYDRLEEVREATERYSAAGCAPWHSEVDDPETGARLLIVIDPGASTATLAHVVHTAAEAGYQKVEVRARDDGVKLQARRGYRYGTE